jgi:hypothetical protein
VAYGQPGGSERAKAEELGALITTREESVALVANFLG